MKMRINYLAFILCLIVACAANAAVTAAGPLSTSGAGSTSTGIGPFSKGQTFSECCVQNTGSVDIEFSIDGGTNWIFCHAGGSRTIRVPFTLTSQLVFHRIGGADASGVHIDVE
jgi:hypothetical protein